MVKKQEKQSLKTNILSKLISILTAQERSESKESVDNWQEGKTHESHRLIEWFAWAWRRAGQYFDTS